MDSFYTNYIQKKAKEIDKSTAIISTCASNINKIFEKKESINIPRNNRKRIVTGEFLFRFRLLEIEEGE